IPACSAFPPRQKSNPHRQPHSQFHSTPSPASAPEKSLKNNMPNAAILLAAGRGSRLQGTLSDKILAPLHGRPVIGYSAAAFRQRAAVDFLAVTCRDESQKSALAKAIHAEGWPQKSVIWVRGGNERQDSVLHALRSLPAETELVFIHDAARPMLTPESLIALSRAARETGAATLARPVSDTIKEAAPSTSSTTGAILRTIDRSRLWAMQTPQVFKYQLILSAYEQAQATGRLITAATAALEPCNHPVSLLETPYPNPKLTTPADLDYLEFLLKSTR